MKIILKTINLYCCAIYKKRKLLGKKLIGIAELNSNDEFTIHINDWKTCQNASIASIALQARQFLVSRRE